MAGFAFVCFQRGRVCAAAVLWVLFAVAACLAGEGVQSDQVTPNVTATRQGRLLKLDCKLTGPGAGQYAGANRLNPPTFAIYRGEHKVGSGTFEYG